MFCTPDIEKQAKDLWNKTFGDSKEYIDKFFSLYFKEGNFFHIEKEGKLISMLFATHHRLKVNDEINFNESRLNIDFQRIADFIMEAPSDFFMYRDFQSRNIMIKDNQTYFIDYQGGRKGPLQYDIISLLYQVKAQLPNDLRKELLSHYKKKLGKYVNIEKMK